ncbi:beta-ketoacyl-[acyl-carrier-protein] synthase family protein [Streptomyces mobaraensis]|uniref:3-oxoacyl-ACP synthase n=1 Tax=Streptomyces mobaraensis (strain ATCC 29032 / DSM 40847 / JCM 4168 / NBRC 13819 / NCIMB 11159 / IPCR 16-22) TaxID=1223523 RepID=M3BBL5_STRM1|nr:3-oxoacyl-ACP synthase [Streptomyces mobaraensis NBRC 13819 = DSM 40847]
MTGLGLVTAGGIGREPTWDAVCAGVGTATRGPALQGHAVDFCCALPALDDALAPLRRKAWRLDPFARAALLAAREAVADAGLDPAVWDGPRVGVVIGSGSGGGWTTWHQQARLRDRGPEYVSSLLHPMSLINMAAAEVALDCGALGPSTATVTACASGADALSLARLWLTAGRCDVVLAGGTEAGFTPLNMVGFDRLGVLSRRRDDPPAASRPFDAERDGFVAGEGAAVLVLERPEHARARGAVPRALFAGSGSATDAYHPTAPHPEGAGARRALRLALADAGVSADEVDHVNAHGTGTPPNDLVEGRVIEALLPHGPSVTATKGVLGHTLGAAGAVEAAVTVLTVQHGLVPPVANLERLDPALSLDAVRGGPRKQRVDVALSNSFGFGGHNTVLVFRTAG